MTDNVYWRMPSSFINCLVLCHHFMEEDFADGAISPVIAIADVRSHTGQKIEKTSAGKRNVCFFWGHFFLTVQIKMILDFTFSVMLVNGGNDIDVVWQGCTQECMQTLALALVMVIPFLRFPSLVHENL